MQKSIVGIDISKLTLDWAVKSIAERTSLGPVETQNTVEGINKLLEDLQDAGLNPHECWFCFEHTGSYGYLLQQQLEEKGLTYSAIPALQIQRSLGITRGKTDKIDAERIAMYGYTFREFLKPGKLPDGILMQMKQLLAHRQFLIKTSTRLQNSLSSLKQTEFVVDVEFIRHQKTEELALVKQHLDEVERALKTIIQAHSQVKENYNLLVSIKGIGLIIAAYLIVTTGNFSNFANARKYNCYIGIAPFEHSSGTSIRKRSRVSNLGLKILKTLLYNGAKSAMQYDPEIKAYRDRKLKEGKEKGCITNAVACKLIARAFAVVKRGTPYVVTYKQKVA